MLPVYSVRDVPGPYRVGNTPLPLGFSQVVILKLLKVVYFHTLLQVLILRMLGRQLAALLSGPDKTREIADRGAIVKTEISGRGKLKLLRKFCEARRTTLPD
jgi:hypothetical protein